MHKKGIRPNLLFFLLLLLINLFVGAMVGLERTILPLIGEKDFQLNSYSAALSFIISFGFSKAIMNLLAGRLADRLSRKKVLLIGWMAGLLVPLGVIFATSWWMIIVANVFLGINQGLCWSMTVNMKVDIVKSNQRGLVIGLNEFVGYLGLALSAAITGFIATNYALRPEPFYLGIGFVLMGLVLSLLVKDTSEYVTRDKHPVNNLKSEDTPLNTLAQKKTMVSSSFAGLTTNLKDGMAWGIFPFFFAAKGLNVSQIAFLVAMYPAAWSIFQLFTGSLSDRIGRKLPIVTGMMLQSFALWWILLGDQYSTWMIGSIILGLGTAFVYPTLQAAISDVAAPQRRATSLGIYRFWRDSGYAFGALIAGIIVDLLNLNWAIGLVALFPLIAGVIVIFNMKETLIKRGHRS